jgi:hypothetical protein
MSMRKYREYTDEQFLEHVKNVKSVSGLLRKLNLKPAGGNFANAKRLLQKLKANTAHWTGQAWNKGEQLKDWAEYTKANNLKPHLINHRSHKCEKCKLEMWLEKPIPLEIHHIDGNATNNTLDNLQLLCLNCHYQTDN